MNKVKRGSQYEEGYFKEKRYTWICTVCNREWYGMSTAQMCNHTNFYDNIYTDESYPCVNIEDFPREILTDQDGKVSYR